MRVALRIAQDLYGMANRVDRALLAQSGEPQLFLGEDFLPWMVLAFGAAMVVGPLYGLIRPPGTAEGEPPQSAPIGRTVSMVIVGLIAAVWGFASLVS